MCVHVFVCILACENMCMCKSNVIGFMHSSTPSCQKSLLSALSCVVVLEKQTKTSTGGLSDQDISSEEDTAEKKNPVTKTNGSDPLGGAPPPGKKWV